MARALICQYQYRIHDFFSIMAKMKWNFSIDVIANEWEKILLILKKAFLKVAFIQKVLMPDDMENYHYKYDFFCHN